MLNEQDMPAGFKKEAGQIRIDSSYRQPVEFDNILPGDVIIYRGSDMRYYFIYGRTRDLIHGWHFGGTRHSDGGWGHSYEEFVANNCKADRVAPILVQPLLKFYDMQYVIKSLQKGDGKVE